jgi:hypothetical protein
VQAAFGFALSKIGSASLVGSSGSGTMIRRAYVIRNYFWRGGERGKIGQLIRVSFTVWDQAERFNPEGSRGPEGERKSEDRQRVSRSDLATGVAR